VAAIERTPGIRYVEFDLALDKDFNPCGSKDWDNCWVRAKADVRILSEDQQSVVHLDWKTGKVTLDKDQLKLSAAMEFDAHPQIQKVTSIYAWTAYGTHDYEVYYRQERDALWEDLMPEVREMQESFVMNSWKAKPGHVCKWCPANKAKLCDKAAFPYEGR